jgi:hypothetical protein
LGVPVFDDFSDGFRASAGLLRFVGGVGIKVDVGYTVFTAFNEKGEVRGGS